MTEKGQIIYEFVRGVTTYRCTCGSGKLRPYRIVNEDGGIITAHIVCLECGGTTSHEWEELIPSDDYQPEVNGDVDDKPIE